MTNEEILKTALEARWTDAIEARKRAIYVQDLDAQKTFLYAEGIAIGFRSCCYIALSHSGMPTFEVITKVDGWTKAIELMYGMTL